MAVGDSVGADQLRAFIERVEHVQEEIDSLNTDKKEIYAEAKGNGFDPKIIKKIVAIRKQDPNERMEEEAILELYMAALGMVAAPAEDDLAPAGAGARVENIDDFRARRAKRGPQLVAGRLVRGDDAR